MLLNLLTGWETPERLGSWLCVIEYDESQVVAVNGSESSNQLLFAAQNSHIATQARHPMYFFLGLNIFDIQLVDLSSFMRMVIWF